MTDESTRQHLIGRLPRLIGSGVDYNDAMGVIANMKEVADWSRGWEAAGERHEARGDEALAAGNTVTAGEAYFRAASQTLKPGGRQVICDDFRTDTGEQGALGSHKMDMLEAYQWGWGVPGVWTTGHVVNLAEQVGLQLTRDRDLTP